MSISRLATRWPAGVVGIALGRERLTVARLRADGTGWRLEEQRTAELSPRLFDGEATAARQTVLARALAQVGTAIQRRFIPVHVALPDALARFLVFELEALPKTEQLRIDLVRLRSAKDLPGNGAVEWATQPLGTENEKPLLLATGLERPWLECVRAAFREVDIVPWSIHGGLCYRFNHFHEALTQDGHSGALVTLDPDCWSLVLWDQNRRLRYARSRWRRANDPPSDFDGIAADVRRAIHAYVHGGDRRDVARIAVAGDAPQVTTLAETLNRQLHENCRVLAADADLVKPESISAASGLASLALAAAVRA